ncbi:unnamed protein product [Toxocara canis]|uniref:Endoribonuclease n=1 Tax=Toxocara canis TaxID=6265 RepID=A0A183UIW6_TOXCA|nr:unnamed protein product [Toxocara canis]
MGMETATATADDARLQKLVDDMRSADVDKPTDYMLDWGKPVNGVSDQSPNPLFVYVNETIFERPVYKALIDAFNSAIFIPDTCWDDAVEKENRHAQTIFETFTNTSVFQLGLQYLNETGLIGDWSTFRDELWKLWFGAYSRCKGNGALGSSGFEHVFMGERTEKRIVGGHHSWVIFYLEEKGGEINYNGYKRHDGDLSGVIQYTWLHNLKHVGGFNIGTSPAFDFTIFTVCTLRNPNSKRCRYLLDGYPQAVATFLKPCGENGQEKCISTTYPTQWN